MRYIRTPIKADIEKYEIGKGLEDGFEFYSNVITHNFVDYEKLIQVDVNGQTQCPYILTRRGKTFIKENDYIVTEEDGTKLVCGGDKVHSRYTLIE